MKVEPVLITPAEKTWEHIQSSQVSYPQLKELGTERGKVVVCAAGPSLLHHIKLIKQLSEQGIPVCAVKGTANVLIDHGIVPKYAVFMDGQENQIRFFDNPHPDVHYYMASQTHPKVLERLKDHKLTVWHASRFDMLKQGSYKGWYITGGRTTGLRALNLMRALGYNELHILGMDCSFPAGKPSHVYDKPKHSRVNKVWMGEVEYTATMDMCGQHMDFLHMMVLSPETRFVLYGNGMLQMAVTEFVQHRDKPCPWYYMPTISSEFVDEHGRLIQAA